MFRLFKKKKKYEFTEKGINFFKEIIQLLPSRYHFILDQLNSDFLISFKPNGLNFKDWYSVQLNAKLEGDYRNPKMKYFQLQNIYVFNKKSQKKEQLKLSFLEGIFIGFFIEDINFENYLLSKNSILGLKEKHFSNHDKEKLLEIIVNTDEDLLNKLDIEDTFRIEIAEGTFYTIKKIGDGDYLAVDDKGVVYELLHDPYSVKEKAKNINELLTANNPFNVK